MLALFVDHRLSISGILFSCIFFASDCRLVSASAKNRAAVALHWLTLLLCVAVVIIGIAFLSDELLGFR